MLYKLIYLLYIPKTIYFNFHYLPFKQAIFFPIWLYKVKLKQLKGQVIINSSKISPGMIKLGPSMNSLFETFYSHLVWENKGGTCCFKGGCIIGHNSAISIGKNGYLEFGDNFLATTTMRLACYKSITFGNNCRVAWDVIIVDTDFHELVNIHTGEKNNPTKEIIIGNNNWIGIRSLVLKGTETPDYCIAGARSLLNKRYEIPEYSLIAGNPAKLIKSGIYRDLTSYVE